MKYGLHVGPTGPYADVRTLMRLAAEAEAAGWDGFFLWDHITMGGGEPLVDPWVALAGIAIATQRLRIGTMVTPLARRHPWQVAREAVTLYHLSGGRLTIGVGLGDIPQEFEYLGDSADLKQRAARLDEGLDVLAGLWSGEPFSYNGAHYQIREAHFLPRPLQTPRIPIWVAGFWPRKGPFRRAARWDGVFPGKIGLGNDVLLPIDDLQTILAYIRSQRSSPEPFDVVIGGKTPAADDEQGVALLSRYADAGVTWWLEHIHEWVAPFDQMQERIRQGPPK